MNAAVKAPAASTHVCFSAIRTCSQSARRRGGGHFGAIRRYRLLMQRCYKALVAPCLAAKWPLLCGSGNAKKALGARSRSPRRDARLPSTRPAAESRNRAINHTLHSTLARRLSGAPFLVVAHGEP